MKAKYIFIFLLTLVLAVSCKNKKQSDSINDYIRPASVDFTKQDTAEIMNQLNTYVADVKAKDYSNAVKNLYILKGDSILPLTDAQMQNAMQVYKEFNIYDVAVNAFTLKGESENMVKVALQIVKNGNISEGQGVTYIKLRPVKKDGKWYLTFMDNESMRAYEEK